MRNHFISLGIALIATATCLGQSDMRFFVGQWDFQIWGTEDISGPPALTGVWVLESGLDSALALTGTVTLQDSPGMAGGVFTRELIAFDAQSKQYTRTIATNTGAMYLFTSTGWQGDTLIWTGSQRTAGGTVELRERIVRTGPDTFSAIFHRKEGKRWVLQSNERLLRR